jgi:predicted DCC family thiol-disulfide oxidoreductase YuxK
VTAPLAGAAHEAGRTIVFFDGVCGLCNRSVDFLIAHDTEHRLRYAPLQGETFSAATRDRPDLRAIDSIIVLHEKPGTDRREFHVRSRAALFALSRLGPPWTWLQRLALLVPQVLSDAVYRCIARVRYRIWGKTDTCRMPTAEERTLFLP